MAKRKEEVPTVGQVLSGRVKRYRDIQGLTQDDVAERTAKLGYPMNRVTIAKIEKGGTRAENASLVDVLVLAAALDVPPPLLFLPLGDNEQMAITPAVTMHPHLVLDWVAGDESFTIDRRAHNLKAWYANAQPVFLFRMLRELQNACQRRAATDDDFRRLAEHLEYMKRAGLSIPEMSEEWQQRMDEVS